VRCWVWAFTIRIWSIRLVRRRCDQWRGRCSVDLVSEIIM